MNTPVRLGVFVASLLAAVLGAGVTRAESVPAAASSAADDADARALIVARARLELSRVTQYAGVWTPTSGYPMGDVPPNRGACTDLVVRALRAAGIDLQRLVHEDIVQAKDAYGLREPDKQIDHRRATVLFKYFRRHHPELSTDPWEVAAFLPGDVVFFQAKGARLHAAIVSDRDGMRGLPLILENGGPRPVESDNLDARPIVGHFRVSGAALRDDVPTVLHKLLAD